MAVEQSLIVMEEDTGPAELKERLAPLPEADRRKVLGENAVRFYNLGV